ncbi:MAG: RNA-binding S4 domain-containing protein [Bacteroidales bacterium]|nr:RNA-binding S4 domain-containing protein [Bacteroidales bacterium]
MSEESLVRIDKWLWAVRIFKTRNQATTACKKGKILIKNKPVKPSRIIDIDDIVVIKKLPVVYTYRVKELLEKRVAARQVNQYIENLTSDEELKKLKIRQMQNFIIREKGMGRPTKKQRRTLDRLKN